MKGILHRTVSVAMALLLLSSTISWTVDKHLCLGRVMDIAFFSDADDCGMAATMGMEENGVAQDHCCDDETFTVQGQDDLKSSFDDIRFEPQLFLLVFANIDVRASDTLKNNVLSSEYYPPPILIKDIHLLDETFLI